MAAPVIDFRGRLRGAGFDEEQADAIAAGFEALDRRMDGIEAHLARLDGRLRLLQWVFSVLFAAMVALQATTLGVVLDLLSRLPAP